LFLLGCLLLLLTPVVGIFPGPGGIIFFGAGMALVLRYSEWAKRQYVRLKRRFPWGGSWADWSLRRTSARRREDRRKRQEGREAAAAARERELDRLEREDGLATLVLVRHEASITYFIERRFEPEGPYEHEVYHAAIAFSRLYPDIEAARADGLADLARA
jgi:hypothetical protein